MRAACLHVMLAIVCLWLETHPACGWGSEHNRITAAALDVLPPESRDLLAPEAAALAAIYCTFPDLNWACFGEWGGGDADPQLPRFPDTRREWGVSFYCGWDPVLQKGKSYPHRPPESFEAAPLYFRKAVDALQAGRLADGARFAGVMLHYIQDSGAFPHVQPLHRVFHTQNLAAIAASGYTPHRLGQTPSEAAAALALRVKRLVEWTEKRLTPLFAPPAITLDEAKRLCAKELVPATVTSAVAKLRTDKPSDYEAAICDCANECVRACADALFTMLAFAPHPMPAPAPNAAGANLAFNPSFEADVGDGVPDGWYVGWLDLNDRVGRAVWYSAGTHWSKPVKSGRRSMLLLWAPAKGLEWRQTWRRALRVNSGEVYRGTAWIKTRAAKGAAWFALQFYDTAYEAVATAKSEPLKSDGEWQKVSVEARVPTAARWLRIVLHSEARDGAVWFDDIELARAAD